MVCLIVNIVIKLYMYHHGLFWLLALLAISTCATIVCLFVSFVSHLYMYPQRVFTC